MTENSDAVDTVDESGDTVAVVLREDALERAAVEDYLDWLSRAYGACE